MMYRLLAPLLLSLAAPCAGAGEIPDGFVEKTLGASGVKHTAKTKNALGVVFQDVDYVDGKGRGLFILRLGKPEQYDTWKKSAGASARPIPGVGAEAFRFGSILSICARSGSVAACVTPDIPLTGPRMTEAQVVALLAAAL
jgi:hypothetical protein